MSRSRCDCDPEMVFDLVERSLPPEREKEVRAHVKRCPGCRERYEFEAELNSCLKSLDFSEPRSVCEGVAMALPTRPARVRLVWSLLAGVLLLISLSALGLNGTNPAAFLVDASAAFWGSSAILASLISKVLYVAGPVLLAALVAGALLDLVLVAVLVAVTRRTRVV